MNRCRGKMKFQLQSIVDFSHTQILSRDVLSGTEIYLMSVPYTFECPVVLAL